MTKPRKVEEPTTSYTTTPKPAAKSDSAQTSARVAKLEDVRATNAKLMQIHRKVLQKLAQ